MVSETRDREKRKNEGEKERRKKNEGGKNLKG